MSELKNLVILAQQGDDKALVEACRRFEPLVAKLASQAHLKPLYQDARAEGILAVIEAVKSYEHMLGVPAEGYILAKVRYALWNMFKRERRRWQRETAGDESDESGLTILERTAADTDVVYETELNELRRILRQALNALPERQRRVVAALFWQNKSQTELAAELGISPQAVHNLRERALTRLKKECAGMW